MIWITFGWISGWGQLKSGQTRSNFEVGLFKQNWYLSDSVFDGEFNDGIFIFVDGLEFPKIAIQNFDMCGFRVFFLGNLVTKNWRIVSKFGMSIANTSLHNIYSGFLKFSKICFYRVFRKFSFLKMQNFENPR